MIIEIMIFFDVWVISIISIIMIFFIIIISMLVILILVCGGVYVVVVGDICYLIYLVYGFIFS